MQKRQSNLKQLQHYVPRFLLRQFGMGKKNYVHVVDKYSSKEFSFSASKKSAASVAAEYGMYDFDFSGASLTLEPGLSALETKASEYVVRIASNRRLSFDDPTEISTLACFIVVQMVRTRAIQETHADITLRLRRWLEQQGMSKDFFEPDPLIGEGENAEKALMAKAISTAPQAYGPILLEKDWVLIETKPEHPFLMGDHPVALFNDVERPGRGNLGLKSEGIQIYFPLSPTVALAIWCPSIRKLLIDFAKEMEIISQTTTLSDSAVKAWRHALDTLDAIHNGTSLQYAPDNVEHFNSLQVIHAERFVFSHQKDFALVHDMIAKDEECRHGLRAAEGTGKF